MPTQKDFITQIKADLENEEGESSEVLNERLRRVEAAGDDDDAASEAYFGHLKEVREAQEAAERERLEQQSDAPAEDAPVHPDEDLSDEDSE